MAIRRRERSQPDAPRRHIYAFVDGIADAVPENLRTRMSLLLDEIDAETFDRTGTLEEGEDHTSLMLARITTTPKRLVELFGIQAITEGNWLKVEVGRAPP